MTSQDFKLISKRYLKKINKKSRRCLFPNCRNNSIKSHIIQRKGILSEISEDNHIYALKVKDILSVKDDNAPLEFKKIGLKKAMSYPLYCNDHDTSLFATIEQKDVDFEDYNHQCLVSYRAVCHELRKKELQLDFHSKLLENEEVLSIHSDIGLMNRMMFMEGLRLGISDLLFFKEAFEKCIINAKNEFTFYTYDISQLGIATSAIFSPTDSALDELHQALTLNTVFFNLLPKNGKTKLIIGYHNKNKSNWIENYCKTWKKLTLKEIEEEVSNILIKRCETWAMSPTLFNKLTEDKKKRIIEEFLQDISNYDQTMKTTINIFEN